MPYGRPEKRGRDKVYVYGKHALAEALAHAPRAVRKCFSRRPWTIASCTIF